MRVFRVFCRNILTITVSLNPLRPIADKLNDGENNAITYDVAYRVGRNQFMDTMRAILQTHGPHIHLLPISGHSGGGGIFQRKPVSGDPVIGLQIAPATEPNIRHEKSPDITQIALDEIVLDAQVRRIYAGASITLDQLNRTLAYEIGAEQKVLGADLTSYTYAQVGATFMTGGMGPQRRYFSDSVDSIALFDGNEIVCLSGESAQQHAGAYGWSGIVTAVCCHYHALPENEIAFALPISNDHGDLARLLTHLCDYCFFEPAANGFKNRQNSNDLVFGIEHITADAMQLFLQSGDNDLTRRARQILNNCKEMNVNGVLFINAYSDKSTDEFLMQLVDDANSASPSIAGIALDYAEVFNDPEQMRAVREGVPFAARMQSPQGKFSFKGHTDGVVRLNPERARISMESVWQANDRFVSTLQGYFHNAKNLRGEVLIYGHLNPFGVDPHNRVTLAADDEEIFDSAVAFVHEQMRSFYRDLDRVCRTTDSIFVGGEKSAASEAEIFEAFETHSLPRTISDKLAVLSARVQSSSPMFNWRAIHPYNTQN
ncbi:MAG: hypothetical protein AAF434_09400 [Pseudomonadota bacterium]